MDQKIRDFANACHENSIYELETALSIGPDKTDCETWDLTEQEWIKAVETAINERQERIGE